MNQPELLTQTLNTLGQGAAAFRMGMEAVGNERLCRLSEQLELLIQGCANPAQVERLLLLLEELYAAQERGDMLWVADLLEFEIQPICLSFSL